MVGGRGDDGNARGGAGEGGAPSARGFFVVTGGAVGDVELHEVDLGPSRGGVVELREGVDAVLDAHAARDGDAEVTAQALGGPGGAHVAAVQGVVRERGRAVETAPPAVRLVRHRGEQEHAREPRQNLPQEGVGGSHRGLRANLACELGLAVELRLKPRGVRTRASAFEIDPNGVEHRRGIERRARIEVRAESFWRSSHVVAVRGMCSSGI